MTRAAQKQSTQERIVRGPNDTITISFERFKVLRSIAESVRVGDNSRQRGLVRELDSLEVQDYMKLLEPEHVSILNNDRNNKSDV